MTVVSMCGGRTACRSRVGGRGGGPAELLLLVAVVAVVVVGSFRAGGGAGPGAPASGGGGGGGGGPSLDRRDGLLPGAAREDRALVRGSLHPLGAARAEGHRDGLIAGEDSSRLSQCRRRLPPRRLRRQSSWKGASQSRRS